MDLDFVKRRMGEQGKQAVLPGSPVMANDAELEEKQEERGRQERRNIQYSGEGGAGGVKQTRGGKKSSCLSGLKHMGVH